MKIILIILNSILYAIFYLNLKGLMKYKYISPSKCYFMIGLIIVPSIIISIFGSIQIALIIYIIISE